MLVIYGICLALAVLSLLLSGVTQLYAFLGVFIAFGLVLFLPTRGSTSIARGARGGRLRERRRGEPMTGSDRVTMLDSPADPHPTEPARRELRP